jgi:hypothetical protein
MINPVSFDKLAFFVYFKAFRYIPYITFLEVQFTFNLFSKYWNWKNLIPMTDSFSLIPRWISLFLT